MAMEEMYLENIDEYVKDENKLVTFKWLSLTLQVHCNTAKQMLFKYVDTERNTKDNDELTVSYFVSGLCKPNDAREQMFKCSVVPEEKLEAYKSTLDVLTSCHIYSVQSVKLKDSNLLYTTDYEKFKENAFETNTYSGIHYERAQPRSADDLQLLAMNTADTTEPEKKASVTNGSASNKAQGKKQPQSALQNMFAKADASKKQTKDTKDVKPVVKTENKDSNKTTSNKKAGGMMTFFSKDADKKSTKATTSKKPVETSPKKTVKDEAASKKKAREVDSDEEEVVGRSKRRRTGQDLFDSDSEEEMEAEEESPIPPTPPRNLATPEPDMEEMKDPSPKPTSKTEESLSTDNRTKRRIKKRKAVNKTYMDNDGFMVTEKVYEEVSTDASESEDPGQKETKKPAASKSPAKGKKSPKKTSPGKKGQASGKQTSLMSFFTKKN